MSTSDYKRVTVFVVEDNAAKRDCLVQALKRSDQFEVVGQADNAGAALQDIAALQPDVVLMDSSLPQLDGVEATRQLRDKNSQARVMLMATEGSGTSVIEAMGAGALAFWLKHLSALDLQLALQATAAGAIWLDPTVAAQALSALGDARGKAAARQPHELKRPLSPREKQVLEHLARGLSNHEIGRREHLSTDTVRTHVKHIMEKLAVSTRTEAAVIALREGLVSTDGPDSLS